MIDGKQVKNKSNPTGTGKYLNESGQYVLTQNVVFSDKGNGLNNTVGTPITGTIVNTIAYSKKLNKDIFVLDRCFKIELSVVKEGIATNTVRVYHNTTESLTGATLLLTATMTAGNNMCNILRNFLLNGTTRFINTTPTTSLFIDFGTYVYTTDVLLSSVLDNYLIVAFQLGAVGETARLRTFTLIQ